MHFSDGSRMGKASARRGFRRALSLLDIPRRLPYSAVEPCFVTAPTRILPSLAVLRSQSADGPGTGNERKDMPR